MCLQVSYTKKCRTKGASFKSMKKGVESGVGPGSGSILVRGTDPQIRIRTKILRIPNTAKEYKKKIYTVIPNLPVPYL
jgi:hypothetical protein